MRRSQSLSAIAVAAIALLAVAGCGSSSSTTSGTTSAESGGGAYGSGGSTTSEPASSAPKVGAAMVSVTSVPKTGQVIVDNKGFTLYDFHKDKGDNSSCYGGCEKAWPPALTEGEPQVGGGAMSSKIGMTERKDGTLQVTYAGHPMYTFSEDKKPGEANGNDTSAFGAQWYALHPNGEEAGD